MKTNDKLKYVSGEHLVMCDICGFVVKSSTVTIQYDGLVICPDEIVEERPVFKKISLTEGRTVSDRQQEPTDKFLDTNDWVDDEAYD